jgi:hypothetical protein
MEAINSMNNKASLYVMVAVAVGYVLISAVPQQLSMYADQRQMLSNQPPDIAPGENPEPEGGILGTSNSTSNDIESNNITSGMKLQEQVSRVPTAQDRPVNDFMSIYKWWIIDLTIALAVYFTARRRFF